MPGCLPANSPSSLHGKRSVEDWTQPAFLLERTALEAAFRRLRLNDHFSLEGAVSTYPTLHLRGFHAELHASPQFRRREPCSPVLLADATAASLAWLPWVILRRLFTIASIEAGETSKIMAVIQAVKWYDQELKLDGDVGCPHVALLPDRYAVISADEIIQEIFLWPDLTATADNEVFFVDWWVVSGELRYPEDHRWRLQRQLRWRMEHYAPLPDDDLV